MPSYELRGAKLEEPGGVSLHVGDWSVREGAVTVLLGPAGTGKSTLLRALASCAPPEVVRGGTWRGPDAALLVPQATFRGAPTNRDEGAWRGAPAGTTLLLDEPDRDAPPDGLEALARELRERAAGGSTVVVVTHHLGFARAVGDDFAFLCAGRLHGTGKVEELFTAPPTPLLERFVKQGNAWPQAAPPPLPSNFHWVLPDKLAGMGKPGLLGEEESDLLAIASAGVSVVVSLTEEAFPEAKLRSVGITGKHFPIRDMGVPALGPTARLCREIVRAMEEGERVAVHCHAGLGRTGTMLAVVLAWLGRKPEEAIAEVRKHQPHYLQNKTQTDFVRYFAETWVTPPPPA